MRGKIRSKEDRVNLIASKQEATMKSNKAKSNSMQVKGTEWKEFKGSVCAFNLSRANYTWLCKLSTVENEL